MFLRLKGLMAAVYSGTAKNRTGRNEPLKVPIKREMAAKLFNKIIVKNCAGRYCQKDRLHLFLVLALKL